MATKLTRNQALVLNVLKKASSPLSAYQILAQLHDDGVHAPLQVYRALEKLIACKKVHRLESVNAFMACSHPEHDAHNLTAFVICDQCGKVYELENISLEKTLNHMTEEIGFSSRLTTIEIKGMCTNCKSK